jgi:hypothetical protein
MRQIIGNYHFIEERRQKIYGASLIGPKNIGNTHPLAKIGKEVKFTDENSYKKERGSIG